MLQILGLASMVSMMTIFSEEMFKATGKVKKLLKIEVITTPLRVVAILYGAMYDLITVVTMLAYVPIIRVLITVFILCKDFRLSFVKFFRRGDQMFNFRVYRSEPFFILYNLFLVICNFINRFYGITN